MQKQKMSLTLSPGVVDKTQYLHPHLAATKINNFSAFLMSTRLNHPEKTVVLW